MKIKKLRLISILVFIFIIIFNLVSYKLVEASDLNWEYGDYTLYDITGDMGGGAPANVIGSLDSETIGYAKGRYWAIGWDSEGDIWIWNSTDKQNWFGTEIEGEGNKELNLPSTGSYNGHTNLMSAFDSNGDIHIIYISEKGDTGAPWYPWYIKIETKVDGSIVDLGTMQMKVGIYYPFSLIIDGQDYPICVLLQSTTYHIIGSSTKDGTWTQDYDISVPYETRIPRSGLVPLNTDNGKDFLFIRGASEYVYSRYFDESSETLGAPILIDGSFDWYDYGLGGHTGKSCFIGTPRIWSSFRGNNESIISIVGYDEVNDDVRVNAYRTMNGGASWTKKTIFEDNDYSATDYWGTAIRYNSLGDIFVFYEHNDSNEGNKTWYYSALDVDLINTNYTDLWTKENIEIFNFTGLQENVWEGSTCWSIARGGLSTYIIDNGFMVGKQSRIMSNIDIEIVLGEEEPYPLPELLNVTIRGYEDYLFEGEVYEIDSYWNNTNYCYFQLDDTVNSWRYYYYNESKFMGLNVIGFEGLKENELVAGIIFTNYTYYNATGINQNVSRLQWRFVLGVQVVDCFSETLSYYGENFWGNITSGNTDYTDINIYNLGGYVTYEFNGDAGHIIGGEAFELYAENATEGSGGISYAYSEKIFRKLQHYNGLVELYTEMDWQEIFPHQWQIEEVIGAGYLEYGFDFRYNQTWYKGWKCIIYINAGNIGHHGGGQDTAWIKLNVEWYYNDTFVSEDYIYSYHYAYFPEDGNHSTRLSFNFWIDLWFNQENSSKVVGGRVTPFYLGVQERGWWGFGSFRPMYTDRIASSFATNLEINNVTFSSKELEIIRCWCKMTKLSQDDKMWKLLPYVESHFKVASDRMMGVETPDYVEPKMPAIESQMGFLTGLKRAIENIANTVWMGALGFVKVLWGAMDSLLSFMGFPEGTWSRITFFIMAIPNLLVTLISWIPMILDNMIALIGNMFGFLTVTIGRFIWFLGHFVTTWITWVTEIINFFTGGFSGITNLWELFDLEQWFILAITIIIPIWQIDRIMKAKSPLKQLKEDFELFSSMFTGIFNFFKSMVILIRNLLGAIRSVLPI